MSLHKDVMGKESNQYGHSGPTVLLEIQLVELLVDNKKTETVMFFDNGSTATICTNDWATRAGLD